MNKLSFWGSVVPLLVSLVYLEARGGPDEVETKTSPSSSSSILPLLPWMKNLPGINVDQWILGFSSSGSSGEPWDRVSLGETLWSIIQTNIADPDLKKNEERLQRIFQNLLKIQVQWGAFPGAHSTSTVENPSVENYTRLIEVLYDTKTRIHDSNLPPDQDPFDKESPSYLKYQLLQLFNTLAEETLYLRHLASGSEKNNLYAYSKRVNSSGDSISSNPPTSLSSLRTHSMLEMNILTGDIMVSRHSGAASSAFIAQSPDRPSVFSHAFVVYVDPTKPPDQNLYSPEALIEDGVKLRPAWNRYMESGGLARLFVFRRKNSDPLKYQEEILRVQRGVDDFVSELFRQTQDPYSTTVFPYDTHINSGDHSSFTCTGVVEGVYRQSGFVGDENPYEGTTQNRYSGTMKELIVDLLGAKDHGALSPLRISSPGDIELHPQFDYVGLFVNTQFLERERALSAAVNVMGDYLRAHPTESLQLMTSLKNIGNQSMSRNQILLLCQKILTLSELPQGVRQSIEGFIKEPSEVPDGMNPKQMIFFTLLNRYYGPKMVSKLQEANKLQIAATGKPLGPLALRQQVIRSVQDEMNQLLVLLNKIVHLD